MKSSHVLIIAAVFMALGFYLWIQSDYVSAEAYNRYIGGAIASGVVSLGFMLFGGKFAKWLNGKIEEWKK